MLLALLDGWAHYRRYVRETPGLTGHQVETWNGWWVTHRFGDDYDERRPLRGFQPALKKSGEGFRLETQDWVRLLFALARRLPERTLTAYVFSFGSTNQTVGFRQVRLPEVHAFSDLYLHLFGEADGVANASALAALYRTEFGFRTVCREGAIGLRAIQPAKLHDYVPRGGNEAKTPRPPKDGGQRLTFHLYLTWITAMLDNRDLIALAEGAADALRQHAASATKGRSTAQRRAEQVLDAPGRRAFIEGLAELVQHEGPDRRALLDRLVDAVVALPASDFPLLLTLMRFKFYAQA